MKPYKICDIADYVIIKLNKDEHFSLINLKLQKLMYYIQAWSLGINGCPLFVGKFEAWVHGPVSRELYDRFKPTKTLYSLIGIEDIANHNCEEAIAIEDKDFVDYILENYAGFSGVELESMTHSEEPWIEARGEIDLTAKCTNEISEETMKSFYGKKWQKINGTAC